MSLRRGLWLALPIALAIGAVGCKDEAAPAPVATATAEAVKAPAAAPAPTVTASAGADHAHGRGRGRNRAGIVGAIFRAAHDLDLKDAQKATVEKLGADLRGDGAGQPSEMKDYHTALLAQVRAGKIETAKLDPLQAAAEKAMKARREKEAEALNGLYAALEPAQRKALVAAVRAKQAAHKPDPAKAEAHAKDRLAHLTKQLDLDAAQQKKVEPLLAKEAPPAVVQDAMKQHADAVLGGFEGDGFDAKKLEPKSPPGAAPMTAHAQFLAALLPILKPEQREKLAADMEKPGRGMRHGPNGEANGMPADDEPADEAPAAE
jgi:Spy/CpxP family protein refolding chaperone